ncbi:MAG: hypothetical protein UT42_C0044G0010 [Candidatus Falkowbacteria bacterium GW2011_GWA2_39_24]|uniref:Uncharacterized protein n=1 Tax=Candidatus Falkowbacteria bacterium GW2011_GWA2_39_24 TaxID=1618634 RepID=A0A0G0NLC7_9BACT|nr:MAG: hypothetical protein UT42_C0044G0010 [Candidatus Falkowbacteria bacterium GW2011_GWA2_39_24]
MEWIQNNWFNVLQSIGIIASVLFTAYVVRVSNKSKKVENLLLLNQYHREIWLYYLDNPHLSSIFKKDIPEDYNPTDIENRFVSIIILHLNTAFLATKAGVIERNHQ